jgi:hypothetical protein
MRTKKNIRKGKKGGQVVWYNGIFSGEELNTVIGFEVGGRDATLKEILEDFRTAKEYHLGKRGTDRLGALVLIGNTKKFYIESEKYPQVSWYDNGVHEALQRGVGFDTATEQVVRLVDVLDEIPCRIENNRFIFSVGGRECYYERRPLLLFN